MSPKTVCLLCSTHSFRSSTCQCQWNWCQLDMWQNSCVAVNSIAFSNWNWYREKCDTCTGRFFYVPGTLSMTETRPMKTGNARGSKEMTSTSRSAVGKSTNSASNSLRVRRTLETCSMIMKEREIIMICKRECDKRCFLCHKEKHFFFSLCMQQCDYIVSATCLKLLVW